MARPKPTPADNKEPTNPGGLPPVSTQGQTKKHQVTVGDVVIFLQPSASITQGLSEHIKVPMMVTRVHNDGVTIDGMLFGANGSVAFTGTRDVYDVKFGKNITNWEYKQGAQGE